MDDSKKSDGQLGDSPTLPSWIDKDLIQQAVRNAGDEKSLVVAIHVSSATVAGDNYASSVYRVKATLTDGKERSFIIKGPVPGEMMASMTKESGIFRRETIMLADIIPKMEALLEEAAPGRFPPLAPRCYHSGSEPVEFIVAQDLTDDDFRIADRKRGLGLRHSLMALRSLARFHGASYALLKRQPGLADALDNNWRKSFDGIQAFLDAEFQAVADACRTWPGFEQYAERLEKYKSVAMERFTALNDPAPDAFNVITHGDFWVNNMMFRYADGWPSEHRAIDLQLSHVASPALDILYFFAGSLSEDVHVHHQDLLLREYYFEFKETMELLGHEVTLLQST
ncbi:hypothetical protein R5R35_001162 [Gryllus longicercus]|uniref:CHK kinase-like domain-containing protein n=1 Tax=Gryllus longicercus TaxID=2509291 RepID=A0AAN9VZE7_9ORTH